MALLTRRQLCFGGLGMAGYTRALADQQGPKYVPGQILARLQRPDQVADLEKLFYRSGRIEPILQEELKRPSAATGKMLWRISLKGDFLTARAMADEKRWFGSVRKHLGSLGLESFRNTVVVLSPEPLAEFDDPLLPLQDSIRDLRVDVLWRQGIIGSRNGVALIVIDNGIKSDHPDLFPNMSLGETRYFFGPDAEPRDGHGTFVAGIAGAVGNNGIGISGVAPNCEIVSLKALDLVEILGYFLVMGTEASLASALYHVLNNYDQAVVCMAWGTHERLPLVEEAIRLGENQFLAVAAVGNNKSHRSSIFPAGYSPRLKNLLSVTAVDRGGTVAPFANHHRPTTDIGLPGVGLISTTLDGYAQGDGTSFAAAYGTGLGVLVSSSAKALYGLALAPARLRQAIVRSGVVDPRQAQFDPIPVLHDATRVWNEAVGPGDFPRARV